ncbi:MAG: phosphate acyltransferase PlsX [Deltaproteobacteria bacterium]|nr:phosphate acyltransferase PlsX [Deltaproteobacteria bacterium]
MKIALDAMGSDNAPQVEIDGAVRAAREYDVSIILVGDREILEAELAKRGAQDLPITVKSASQVVGMHESPSVALRKKKDSSIRVAFDLVKCGEADAVVSAGNSGAAMATGMFVLRKLKGVDRPAIATVVPTLKGQSVVLDVGANVDCKPDHLVQFAVMGEVYARYVLGVERPKVGLLSNGEEEEKGNDLTRETHGILKKSALNYAGYIEGRDIYSGEVDVVTCDGFVGNIFLKTSEGLAEAIGRMLKEELKKSFLSKIGYLLARGSFKTFKKKVDYSEYGGAPLLGINGVGFISHGGSNANAIKNAIRVASEFVRNRVNKHLLEEFEDKVDLGEMNSQQQLKASSQ